MIVREATEADASDLAAIYRDAVLHGFGTFEEEPPTAVDMDARRRAVQDEGLPYLVAEVDGRVLGFAYAGPFRPRAAYRYTLEDSVYVSPDAKGQGVGRAVLSGVIAACEALGVRQLMAVIGDTQNAGSIGLHKALGFEQTGVGRSVGFKHGRWVDIVHMQKALNGGDTRAPDGPGVTLTGH
ncbi:MAG TPA: GNAT family N-acetyltransferase [Phenylobacterium sp.]|jgi:phosphinothricin acetyltransferase|uniref:GNAT family N-acetyltransferase n=1 Tax=Phenylobacterium sp. TaxID=1871053 RepID=UPI002D356440|nr:GNAT family N-acetyltransferase [Phenylobacterium sp.]HZZ69108.1 GNAT family N-acetyltransferase [Phenylobacterium sp.]